MKIKQIIIKDVGTIKDLKILPTNPVETPDNAISNKGCIIQAKNTAGKTTLIKAIADTLGNLVKEQGLNNTEAVRKDVKTGQYLTSSSFCEIVLEDDYSKTYVVSKTWRVVDNSVNVDYLLKTEAGTYYTLKDIQNTFKFSYISPEEIKVLATTKSRKGDGLTNDEQKLIKYFIMSLREEQQEKFVAFLNKEMEIRKERSELTPEFNTLKKEMESRRLTEAKIEKLKEKPEIELKISSIEKTAKERSNIKYQLEKTKEKEHNALVQIQSIEKDVENSQNYIQKITKDVALLKKQNELAGQSYSEIFVSLHAIKEESYPFEKSDALIKELEAIKQNISNIWDSADGLKQKNALLKEANQTLISQKGALKEAEKVYKAIQEEVAEVKIQLEKFEDEAKILENLTFYKKLEKEVSYIEHEKKQFEDYQEKVTKLEKDIFNKTEEINKLREFQVQIIKDENIDIPGFEITPKGLKFNGLSVSAASDMEGAKFAALFSAAMNRQTKVVFVNEILKFDLVNRNQFINELNNKGYQIITNEVELSDIKVKPIE